MKETIDTKGLKNIANKTGTSEAIFVSLAARERNRETTDLRRLKARLIEEGFKIIPEEFASTFKELQKAGVGEFIHKPGQTPKFRWHRNLIEVGKLAVEEEVMPGIVKPLPTAVAPKPVEAPKPAAKLVEAVVLPLNKASSAAAEVTLQSIWIILSKGRRAELSIPKGLTMEEATAISEALMRQAKN